MVREKPLDLHSPVRKGTAYVLAVFWLAGILYGILCFAVARSDLSALMRSTITGSVSIVGLLSAVYLPFLLSAFALLFSLPWMLFCVCFCKAFLFAFVSLGLLLSFPGGGWLFRYFLLFGDCAVLPVLYWYWLHSISVPSVSRWFPTILTSCAGILAVGLDYRVISPYFECLIDSMKG